MLPRGGGSPVSVCDCTSQPITQQLTGILTLVFGWAYAFWRASDGLEIVSVGWEVIRVAR